MRDLIKREITYPYAVRNAIITATASLTTGTNTTLKSGESGYPLDLVQIGFSNNSDAATTVTLSDDGTTIHIFPIAANTAQFHQFQPPLIQGRAGGNWQVDLPDITGTTITVNAEFIEGV